MSLRSLPQVEPVGGWQNSSGSHSWQYLFTSPPSNSEAVRVGVWKWIEMDDGDINEIVTSEYDEVKYILSGTMSVKDLNSGQIHHLKAGSLLWIEKGSRSKVLGAKDLLVLFVDPNSKKAGENDKEGA